MNYTEFVEHIKQNCLYETMYDDSEGRSILVIRTADAWDMVNDIAKREQNETKVGLT